MSAEDLGRRLLGEVDEGSLSEILAKLSATRSIFSATSITGIDTVDRLIALHHGSRAAIHRQLQPCVEITSPGTDDGKTQLLYYVMAQAILPSSVGGIPLHGQQSAVVFFDADGTFNISQLERIIRHRITIALAEHTTGEDGLQLAVVNEDDISNVMKHSLQHVHVLSPQTIGSMVQTTADMPAYLFDSSRHYSSHRRVHSIMVDSATSFYWADRNDVETASIPATIEDANNRSKKHTDSAYPKLRAALHRLSQELSCPIIYTANNLFARPGYNQSYAVEPSLHKSWHSFPTARLLIRRDEVRGMPIATSADEARQEAGLRNTAVAQGAFSLVVNEDRSEEWTSEVKAEMVRTGNRRTVVRITAEGVSVGR